MRLSGPEDLIRHGYCKRRAPFKLSLRAPFGAFQIDASGGWVKPPSSGGRLINDNWAFWTSNRRHQCAFLRRKDLRSLLNTSLAPAPISAGHPYDCEGSELSVPFVALCAADHRWSWR